MQRPCTIAILHADAATDGYLMLNFHMGAGESQPGSEGESIQPVSGFHRRIKAQHFLEKVGNARRLAAQARLQFGAFGQDADCH